MHAAEQSRVSAAPLVGDVLSRVVKPNRRLLVRLMASMGEEDTVPRYPELIESLAAAARDPINAAANLAELRAVIVPFGFRPSARIAPDELRRLTVPMLLIAGRIQAVAGWLETGSRGRLRVGHRSNHANCVTTSHPVQRDASRNVNDFSWLLLVPLVLSLGVQQLVRSVYRASEVEAR